MGSKDNDEESRVPYGQLCNNGDQAIRVYSRRWYVLAVFCMYGFTMNCKWNTWGPISSSAELVFGWSNSTITQFAMANNCVYVLTALFVLGAMDKYGLRVGFIGSGLFLLAGALVRCISSKSNIMFGMALLDQLFGGVASSAAFAGPPLFSAVWFPGNQRTTSTAIASMSCNLGLSASLLIGPQIVKYVDPNENKTNADYGEDYSQENFLYTSDSSEQDLFDNINGNHSRHNHTADIINKQRQQIMNLMYIEAAWTGLMFILILVYFPKAPPTPPSVSAATDRINPASGVLQLSKKPQFWYIVMAYALPTGSAAAWSGVLNINFEHLGVTQTQAGWVGFCYVTGGAVAGLFVTMFSNLFSRHMKLILIVLFSLASGSMLWVILLNQAYIPFNLASLYISVVSYGVFLNGSLPLFYELICELFFPVPEGVTGGYLTLCHCLVGILFLAMFQNHYLSVHASWINWTQLGLTLVAIPLIVIMKENYGKLTLDDQQNKKN